MSSWTRSRRTSTTSSRRGGAGVQDLGKLVLRLTLAGLILFHGIDKVIHGIAWMSGPLHVLHLPAFVACGVYVGEVAAPLFVAVGIGTRIAALTIAFDMVMAIALEAWRLALTINRVGGWGMELEAFYLMTAVAVALLGPGTLSLLPGFRPPSGSSTPR